jgi:hypothetical protein
MKTKEGNMRIIALILGVIGGLLALAIAMGIDVVAVGRTMSMPAISLPNIGTLMTVHTGGQFAAAAAAVLGGLIVVGNRMVGGALMLIGAAGMVLTFGVPSVATTATILSALGAVVAIFTQRGRAAASA